MSDQLHIGPFSFHVKPHISSLPLPLVSYNPSSPPPFISASPPAKPGQSSLSTRSLPASTSLSLSLLHPFPCHLSLCLSNSCAFSLLKLVVFNDLQLRPVNDDMCHPGRLRGGQNALPQLDSNQDASVWPVGRVCGRPPFSNCRSAVAIHF